MRVTVFDHPRTEWHPTGAQVLDSDGDPRPALAIPLGILTIHWTGAGEWSDTGDTRTELLAVERFAVGADKPNEYNSATDSQSETWEYAGPFRAAHSEGENEEAWGNLVFAGPSDVITPDLMDRYVAGILRLRRQLVAAGYLTADHVVIPHREMPGASTACPGPLADDPAVWARIAGPYALPAPPPPPPPPPEEDPDMRPICLLRFQNITYVAWAGYKTWPGTPGARAHITARYPGLLTMTIDDDDLDLFKSYGSILGARPKGRDQWGILREAE